jgi:WD40 repeat protein
MFAFHSGERYYNSFFLVLSVRKRDTRSASCYIGSAGIVVFIASFLLGVVSTTRGVGPPASPRREVASQPPLPLAAHFRLGSLCLRHLGEIDYIALSRDGKTLVSAGGDAVARVWNLTTGDLLWQFKCDPRSPLPCALDPGGQTIAIVVTRRTIGLFSTATGKLIRGLHWPHASASALCFSPDGKSLALGDQKGKIHLWDIVSGKTISSAEGHEGGPVVTGLAFLNTGKGLASCGSDGHVHIWDLAPAISKAETIRTSVGIVDPENWTTS